MSFSIRGIARLLQQPNRGIPPVLCRNVLRLCSLAAPLALALASAGCGSSSGPSYTGLQPAPKALPFTYVGTSPRDNTVPAVGLGGFGLWSAFFNHTNQTFSAEDVTLLGNNIDLGIASVAGPITPAGSFLALTQTNDPNIPPQPAGYALEIPGRAAILRQGDSTYPLAAMVPNGCPGIHGPVQFNFVALPTDSWDPTTDPAYGSVTISNTSNATNWKFSSFAQLTLAGTAATNNGAALPAGICGPTIAGTAVYLPTPAASGLPATIAVGPSGFYIADESQANSTTYLGEFGVLQPASQLNTSDVLSHTYAGFIYEAGAGAVSIPESQMASFTPSVPAGQLNGGGYTNDDPTQAAATNLTIDLGSEDPKTNGLYPNAVVTDSNTGAVDAAVAVVGNPEGKYAIFLITEDSVNTLPLGIYLFQQ